MSHFSSSLPERVRQSLDEAPQRPGGSCWLPQADESVWAGLCCQRAPANKHLFFRHQALLALRTGLFQHDELGIRRLLSHCLCAMAAAAAAVRGMRCCHHGVHAHAFGRWLHGGALAFQQARAQEAQARRRQRTAKPALPASNALEGNGNPEWRKSQWKSSIFLRIYTGI